MSCADVCIDMLVDDPAEFTSEKIVRARKAHKCVECDATIASGDQYERTTGLSDGCFWSEATCLICHEIRKAFVCGSWYLGMLWECIAEELFPRWRREGPFECMAKLTTQAARDRCLAVFTEWEAGR